MKAHLNHRKGFLGYKVTRMASEKEPEKSRDNGFFDFIMEFVKAEIRKPEMKDEILKPLLKWILWNLLPYLFLFLGLNFFFTMLAVLLVTIFIKR